MSKEQAGKYQTIRIWVETQQQLKLLAALTHESMIECLDRLVKQDLQRVQKRGGERHASKDI